jgi:hypothetical protein
MIKVVCFNQLNVKLIIYVGPNVLDRRLKDMRQFAHILLYLVYIAEVWFKE